MKDDKSIFLESLGRRIKEIRKSKKISQRLMSSNLNIDERHLRRIEKGKTNPTISLLLDISNYLEIDLADLFIEEKSI